MLFDGLPVQRQDLENWDGWMAHVSNIRFWNELWTGVGIMPPKSWASNTCGSYNLGSIISLIGCNCSCKPWTPPRRVTKLTSHCGHFKARPVSFPRGRARPPRPAHFIASTNKGDSWSIFLFRMIHWKLFKTVFFFFRSFCLVDLVPLFILKEAKWSLKKTRKIKHPSMSVGKNSSENVGATL